MKKPAQTREQRLAAALRENLKKRKARIRALEKAAETTLEPPGEGREATTKAD